MEESKEHKQNYRAKEADKYGISHCYTLQSTSKHSLDIIHKLTKKGS